MFSYIHIPFCESKCKYCRFASTGKFQDLQIKKYLAYLLEEINNYDLKHEKLESIYFGGGTPTTLNSSQLEQIIKTLENKFGFEKNIEISLETTPSKVKKQNLEDWKKLGINRLSIGVQTLNEKTLKEIGRGNKGDILEALDNIKEVGFNNISLDFIVGLPHTSLGETKKNIEYILDNYSFVKHISVYMLEEYYYPENWEGVSINEEDYFGEYDEIVSFLKTIGFNRYEVSNFAKSSYECKHNQSYWNHNDNIGFGLSAHSFVNGRRFANSNKFENYYKGELDYKEILKEEDLFLEKMMFGLRTNGIGEEIIKKLNKEKIKEFLEGGYLKKEEDLIKLKNKGVLVLDYILKEII